MFRAQVGLQNEKPLFCKEEWLFGFLGKLEPMPYVGKKTAIRCDFLIINQWKDSDMYFLNNYKVTLQQKDNPIVCSRTINLERDYRVTALQAFKLLSDQAIEKDVFL